MARGLVFAVILFSVLAFDVNFQHPQVVEREATGETLTNASKMQGSGTGNDVYYTDKFAILTYHHIGSEKDNYTISPERFIEQLDTLRKLGYNFISLEQATSFLEGKGTLPVNAIVVTFDDGRDSFYRYAYPALKQRSIPASMFVIVDYIGTGEAEMRKLSWQEMDEMQKNGFSFYSHTYGSHYYIVVDANGTKAPALSGPAYRPDGSSETWDEFKLRVEKDLREAKEVLEANLGRRAEYLALPFGIANNEAISIAQKLGYAYILTTQPGLNSTETPASSLFRFNAGSPGKSGKSIHQEITAREHHIQTLPQGRIYGHTTQALTDTTTPRITPIFTDVASSHWAYRSIIDLSNKSILKGYTDGTFRPAVEITRAEFLAMLGNAIGWQLPKGVTTPSFSDVDQNTWAWRHIEAARANGVIDGYCDGTFRPYELITRAEIAKIIAEALDLPSGSNNLADADTSWARDYINACSAAGIVDGHPDNTFRPTENTTRAEAAKTLVGLLNYKLGNGHSTGIDWIKMVPLLYA
ncbi:MAG TPA: S-layer homology domain-containing protein [Anaerolineae bacterium]|nr:S-layer homology domain-containing protein [Anaerolineae bacterium]